MKEATEYWNSLSIKQRDHFLKDHKSHFKRSSWLSWLGKDFSELPADVQKVIAEHVKEGLYKSGGSFSDFLAKAKSKASSAYSATKKGAEKFSSKAKETYSKTEKAVKDKVKEQKRKIAVDVLNDTDNKVSKKEEHIHLDRARQIVVNKYANGGGVDDEKTFRVEFTVSDDDAPYSIDIKANSKENAIEYFHKRITSKKETYSNPKITNIEDITNKYAKGGGGFENGIDLFEDYENIPKKVQKILDRYSEDFEDGNYKGIQEALEDLEAIGYTFEYGLDGQAYDLRPIGKKGKTEMYAKGGGVGKKVSKADLDKYKRLYVRNDELSNAYDEASSEYGENSNQAKEAWDDFGTDFKKLKSFEASMFEKYKIKPHDFFKQVDSYFDPKMKTGGGVGRNYRIYYNKRWTNIIVTANNKDEAFEKSKQKLQELYPNERITKSKWAYSNTYFDIKATGGHFENENREMVLNNNKQIKHHTEELDKAVEGKHVPAWVVAKVNRSASDLSDATHYMDGQGEMYAKGGGTKKREKSMTIKDFVLSQKKQGINEWIETIEKNGLTEYRDTIIEAADYFDRITINHNASFTKAINYATGGGIKSIDITYCVKEIEKFNKGIFPYTQDKTLGIKAEDELAERIIKHLGYKTNNEKIEMVMEHLGASSDDEGFIPEDRYLIKEIDSMLRQKYNKGGNTLVKYRFNERYNNGGNTSEWCDCLTPEEIEFACSVENRVMKSNVLCDSSNLKNFNKQELIKGINDNMSIFSNDGKNLATSLLSKLNK